MTDDPKFFISNWPEADRLRYERHAQEIFRQMGELRAASQRNHVDYGRWLIASLLAVHGGSIYAISGLWNGNHKLSPAAMPDLMAGVGWNLFGIGFILVAAFLAWLNFQFAEQSYFRWSDPAMLYRSDRWPKPEERTDPITATLFLAAVFGLMSFGSFIAGAMAVYRALVPG
ncbi:MAG: hypothetical protein EOS81_10560 [Mesorhizobium sp.]|uniref:hypothetical protein n=1 Tax=unclassified Mesorhizobium TaxID=325217 RepID=UPI000F75B61E|nr:MULTISPECIES: hypothetical protein [unclassified Mesorhizobium]RVC70191.1 hypothetical protein EN766_28300 [Mesorhizobium sp. M2A.F.Ca.ET.046.02.1.1]AZO38649.1 hypothetical protein EJ072_32490 [Mesorhizobium sp. M2A.F.Ca.ET.046.03.2.1]RWB37607.1 MAG: hypothetical protein EOQ44_32760 [Mesorhizobium sp.]RWE18775.1 MAG: hypothetical protein EOS76_14785 [Mesorhizobium sp.]RWE99911.1 MAG: hypothetical protein EOS81_10560 [Mesorhizobium sp.]